RSTALASAFPEADGRSVRIRLVEQLPALLAPFHPALQRYAYQQLVSRGVEVRLSAKIREVTADRVLLEDGEALPSDITVWAAGRPAGPGDPGLAGVGRAARVRAAGQPQPAVGAAQPGLAVRELGPRRRADRRGRSASGRRRWPAGAGRRRPAPAVTALSMKH